MEGDADPDISRHIEYADDLRQDVISGVETTCPSSLFG